MSICSRCLDDARAFSFVLFLVAYLFAVVVDSFVRGATTTTRQASKAANNEVNGSTSSSLRGVVRVNNNEAATECRGG